MADLKDAVARLEAVAARLEAVAARSGGSATAGGTRSAGGDSDCAFLEEFDQLLAEQLKAFMDAAAKIGGDVATASAFVDSGFRAQRDFLAMASKSKMPTAAELPGLLTHMSKAIADASGFVESNRKSANYNHIKGVEEGMNTLAWVTVVPKPAPFIKETIGSAQFYTNRVLKDYKDKDASHVDWARAFVALLEALYEYVKKSHTTGVSWNPSGGSATAPAAPAAKPAAAAEAKPAAAKPAAAAPTGDAKSSLFSALSKGEGVTAGLKKVEKSQMTHKNPELRASSVVKADEVEKKTAVAPKAQAAGGAVKKGPPKCELEGGKKWLVEYQDNNKSLVIEDTEPRQTVYIYRCENSVIQIKGKVNSITCDGCKKTAVVFENCISAFEFVNCQSMQVQVTGVVPTISIDKTDGVQVYLSEQCKEANIVTAKSSEMNVLVPKGDGEFTEFPIPEQFKSIFNPKTKKMETNISEIAG